MRVYIAGPMTGRVAYNVGAFEDAAGQWIMWGFTAVTPFEASNVVYRRHFGRNFDPFNDVCDYGEPMLHEIFTENIKLLLSCGAIALLPGWRESRGATVEYAIARLFGLAAYDAETHVPLGVDAKPASTLGAR